MELDEGKRCRDLFLLRNVFYVDNIAVIGIKFRDYEGERNFIENATIKYIKIAISMIGKCILWQMCFIRSRSFISLYDSFHIFYRIRKKWILHDYKNLLKKIKTKLNQISRYLQLRIYQKNYI